MWLDENRLSSNRKYLNFALQNIRFGTIKYRDVITCSKCWKFVTGFTAFFWMCRKWIFLSTLGFWNIEFLIIRFFFFCFVKGARRSCECVCIKLFRMVCIIWPFLRKRRGRISCLNWRAHHHHHHHHQQQQQPLKKYVQNGRGGV